MQYLYLMQGQLIVTHSSCTELHVEIWVVTTISLSVLALPHGQLSGVFLHSYPYGVATKKMKMFLQRTRDGISSTERAALLSLLRAVGKPPLKHHMHFSSGKLNDYERCKTDQENEGPALVEGIKRAGFYSPAKWKLRKNCKIALSK